MSSTDAITVFLPHVFANIKESRIRAIMYSLGWGFVQSVDIKPKKGTDGKVNIVFVHFSSWSDGDDASKVRQMLDADEKVKVVYDKQWFWMISKHQPRQPSVRQHVPAFVDFGESTVMVDALAKSETDGVVDDSEEVVAAAE